MNLLSGTRTLYHADHCKREVGHAGGMARWLNNVRCPSCTAKPGSAWPHSSNDAFVWRRKSHLFLRAICQKISFGYNCKSKWRPLVLQCTTSVALPGNPEPGYRMTKWLLRSENNRSRRDWWGQAVSNEQRIMPLVIQGTFMPRRAGIWSRPAILCGRLKQERGCWAMR